MWVKKKFVESINNALKLYVSDDYISGGPEFEDFTAKKYLETVNLVNDFRETTNDRRKELEDLESKNKELSDKLEAGQGELLRDNSRLKKKLEKLEISYSSSLKEIRKISAEKEKLKKTNHRLETENKNFSQKNLNLNELSNALEGQNRELALSYKDIRADVAKEFANLKMQQGDLLKYNSDLEENLKNLVESYQVFFKERQDTQRENVRLGKANRRLEKKNKELSQEKEALTDLYNSLKRQNRKLAYAYEKSGELFSGAWVKLGGLNKKLLTAIKDFQRTLKNNSAEQNLKQASIIERLIIQNNEFVEKILVDSNNKLRSVSLDIVEVDLTTLLRDVKSEAAAFMSDKKLNFELVVESNAPVKIAADKFRLGWVLKYLILDACANAEKGMVRCRIFRCSPNVCGLAEAVPSVGVEIQNQGKAIPAGGYKTAMEVSQGLYGIRSSQYDDAILGLNLLRELVGILGGKLHLSSVQGEGNTYSLVLPVSIEWRTEKFEADEDNSPRPGDKVFVILEDNHRLVKSLAKTFSQKQYKWLVVSSINEIDDMAARYSIQGLFMGSQWRNKEGEKLVIKVNEKLFPQRVPVCALFGDEKLSSEWSGKFMGYLPNPDQYAQVESVFERIEAYSKFQPLNILTVFNGEQPSQLVGEALNTIDSQAIFINQKEDLALPHSSFDLFLLDLTQDDIATFDLFELVEKVGQLAGSSPIIVCLKKEPSYRKQTFLVKNADIYLFSGGTLSASSLAESLLLANFRKKNPLKKRRENFMDYIKAGDTILQDKQCLIITDSMVNFFTTMKLRKQLTSFGIELDVAAQSKNLIKTLDLKPFLDLIIIYQPQSKDKARGWIKMVEQNKSSKDVPILIIDDKAVCGDRQFWLANGAAELLTDTDDYRQLLSTLKYLAGCNFLEPED